MKIQRNASQPSVIGTNEFFTGSVRIDGFFQAEEPAKLGGATVTFEPGARTAWHTHPLGQTLLVTSSSGWVQKEGEAKQSINPEISFGSLRVKNIGMARVIVQP